MKKRKSSCKRGDQRKNNKSAHRLKNEEESGVKFTTRIKRGLLKSFYFLPQEKSLQNLEYEFKHSKQRAQKAVEEGFKMSKEVSRTSITSSLTKNLSVLQVLFKYTWTQVHLGPSVNPSTKGLR